MLRRAVLALGGAEALGRVGLRGRPSARAVIQGRLASPLYRNGYALVVSSGLTSAIGMAYWLFAARAYSATAVGISAALIAAMTMIANLCQLNLKSGLNRFLPSAGSTSERLVIRSYALATAVAGVVSVAFVAGIGLWSPSFAFLRDRPELGLWFVASTVVWTIFVLQDSVLAGIRRAGWVPLENLAYAVLKLVLLFAMAAFAPLLGTFFAWTAPLLLLVVPVNLLLFRRLIPAHVRDTRDREHPVAAWRMAGYVRADYLAYLIMTVVVGVLPLIVVASLGAKANAYYYVAWSIAYGLYLVCSGLGMSMITEASLEPGELDRLRRETTLEAARLMVPAVVLVVVAAPLLLDFLGQGYAREGPGLLRLLALSALPWIVFVGYTNAARVEGRMRAVVVATAALHGLVLAIGLPLLGPLGVEGLGVGWLAAQTIVAAALLAGPALRRRRVDSEEAAFRALAYVAAAVRGLPRQLTSVQPLREALARVREDRRRRHWVLKRRLATLNDVEVRLAGPPGVRPEGLLKVSTSEKASRSLRAHAGALRALRRTPGLEVWARLAPRLLDAGEAGGRRYVAESRLAGVPGERLLASQEIRPRILAAVAGAIHPLHSVTRVDTVVDERLLAELVDRPIAALERSVTDRSRLARAGLAVERLRAELRASLAGTRVATSRVHGDLCPANVLMSDDGSEVRGIVDWERSSERGLPQVDLLQLAASTRMATQGRELGPVIVDLLTDPRWRESEQPLAGSFRQLELDDGPRRRPLVLLAWLHHVAANLEKASRYSRSRAWIRRNVDPILTVVLREPVLAGAPVASASAGGADGSVARRVAARFGPWWPAGALLLAVGLWAVFLPNFDPAGMTDLGLLSVMPGGFALALLALSASFAVLVHRRPERSGLLTGHLVALIALLHATPVLLYGTLRYSWAWKHVGIVDFFQRHGALAPDSEYLSVYHNWPGFFGADTLLTQLSGAPDALGPAVWGPVFFNLLNLGALLFLFSGLTRDRRVVWLGTWLFFVTCWVGQDYFSPQAFAFFLYLVALGAVVRWLGPRSGGERRTRAAAAAAVLLLVTAIAMSHALTAVMACVALTALVLARVCASRRLAVGAIAITVVWDLVFAADFVSRNAGSTLAKVRLPWATTESSLAEVGRLSAGQATVAGVGRALVVAVALLAAVGAVRALRAGRLNRAVLVLAPAPLLLFASGNYDGEILFRVFLFAAPFLAFLGALSLVASRPRGRPVATVITAVVSAALLAGFLVAYYGKEDQNRFTPAEVSASRWVATHAPRGSLLVEGTHNYPAQFKNYERLSYVTIANEPDASRSRLLADPARVLAGWMAGHRGSSYLILTRSQKVEVAELGTMPRGSLDRIEGSLLTSPRFRVVMRNRDAVVFAPAVRRG